MSISEVRISIGWVQLGSMPGKWTSTVRNCSTSQCFVRRRQEGPPGDRKRQPGLPERHPAAFFGAVQDRSLFDPVRMRADV